MGEAMSTAMQAAYNKVIATTSEKWLSSNIYDLITGIEEGQKPDSASPFLQKMGLNMRDTVAQGGSTLNWMARLSRPNTIQANPVKPYPKTEAGEVIKLNIDWSLHVTPLTIFGITRILNAGSEKAGDLIKNEIRAAMESMHISLAQKAFGNGTTMYDSLTDPDTYKDPANGLVPIPTVADAPPFFGLGFGDDTTDGAILSTKNKYGGKDRTQAAYKRLRARCLDITNATDMGVAGNIADGKISKLNHAHIRQLISMTSLSGITPDMILCPLEAFDVLRNEADAKGMMVASNMDMDLFKFGHINFKIDGVPVVVDKFFMYPLQIIAVNTRNTRLMYCAGEEPSMSSAIWRPELGWQAMYQEFSCLVQMRTNNPGGNGVMYGLTRG